MLCSKSWRATPAKLGCCGGGRPLPWACACRCECADGRVVVDWERCGWAEGELWGCERREVEWERTTEA